MPIHVNHPVNIEGEGTGTAAPGTLVRGQIELNCRGDVCLSRLALPITVHHDAVYCSRAIALGCDVLRRVYRLALGLEGGRERGLPRAGRGSGVMAPPHQTPHVCGPVHNLSHTFGSIVCLSSCRTSPTAEMTATAFGHMIF